MKEYVRVLLNICVEGFSRSQGVVYQQRCYDKTQAICLGSKKYSASCDVFVVSSVVASRLATAFLIGN